MIKTVIVPAVSTKAMRDNATIVFMVRHRQELLAQANAGCSG
jgi:hypothetical protein